HPLLHLLGRQLLVHAVVIEVDELTRRRAHDVASGSRWWAGPNSARFRRPPLRRARVGNPDKILVNVRGARTQRLPRAALRARAEPPSRVGGRPGALGPLELREGAGAFPVPQQRERQPLAAGLEAGIEPECEIEVVPRLPPAPVHELERRPQTSSPRVPGRGADRAVELASE